jgi:hypothetical protein
MPGVYDIARRLCRGLRKFSVPADDPLSPAEIAFRRMLEPVKNKHSGHLELSKEFRVWSAEVLLEWERAHIVWFYGQNERGGSKWGSKRPKPELYASLLSRGQLVWKLRSEFLAELAAAKASGR